MTQISFERLSNSSYPPIFLNIPQNTPDGWAHDQAQQVLEFIIRSFRCRQCTVFKDSQITHTETTVPGDGPHLRSYYPTIDNPNILQVNFACPRSGSYNRKFACYRPHTIAIGE